MGSELCPFFTTLGRASLQHTCNLCRRERSKFEFVKSNRSHQYFFCRTSDAYIWDTSLSHKSGKLCLCDPLNVSDLIFVFFVEFVGVFWAENTVFFRFFPFFFWWLNNAAERPKTLQSATIQSAQNWPYFAPFPGERKCRPKIID